MVFQNLYRFIRYLFSSEKTLIALLKSKIEAKGFNLSLEASGRASLYKLACTLNRNRILCTALIPDYICNIVDKALEKAGYRVQTYSTNRYFDANPQEIKDKIAQGNIHLLLTASIFGSNAFLPELHTEDMKNLIETSKTHVVVDICQDINLIKELPETYEKNLSAIISFNDKSFNGLYGGGILSKLRIPESTQKPNFRQKTILSSKLLMKTIRIPLRLIKVLFISIHYFLKYKMQGTQPVLMPSSARKKFDYSHCRQFPFAFDLVTLTKTQMIKALLGLNSLETINKKKLQYLRGREYFLRTKYYTHSPYLILKDSLPIDFVTYIKKQKASYATNRDQNMSHKSELIIVHNKGFNDY